jgi:hypothetical protein
MWTRQVNEYVAESSREDIDDPEVNIYDENPASPKITLSMLAKPPPCNQLGYVICIYLVFFSCSASNLLYLPLLWEHLFLVCVSSTCVWPCTCCRTHLLLVDPRF